MGQRAVRRASGIRHSACVFTPRRRSVPRLRRDDFNVQGRHEPRSAGSETTCWSRDWFSPGPRAHGSVGDELGIQED
jgi:hypothetical protein